MNVINGIISFILAHQVILAAFGVAVLDLVFALNPASEANGILHWIYSFLSGKKAAA